MSARPISLHDRTDLSVDRVLLSGTQALVRLMLAQAARDRAAGFQTAGYVTGYRGSPLGSVDMAMQAAHGPLTAAQVLFHPALNEDLAATALWGTQTAQARGEGRHQGVFGLWYGKGPGVDRSGDALRHANLAGTAPLGGVVMAMGDDHSGESSTTVHQSEFAAVDAQIPILSPAGVQEILDFGHYGFALSRYAGVWAGLKLMKDTVESTAVVDGRPHRMAFVPPDLPLPADGLSLRIPDHWVPQEVRMVAKQAAVLAFARANGIDRVGWPRDRARVGIVASGKIWLDVTHALDLLGLSPDQGVTTFKVGQVWPLEPEAISAWARGLQLIIVIEEKRALIEPQLKAHLFDRGLQTQLVGKSDGQGVLFAVPQTLDPVMVAQGLARVLAPQGFALTAPARPNPPPARAERQPYFCAGCPHNTSTVVPAGARAGAGIGCHTMALWMDRGTSGLTQMGAEGANWVGEAPFSTRPHIFQNMGDGTFNHSGLMAIRGAVAAGVNITYKLLWNDAVAMTGGQVNDGGLTAQRAAAELLAAGVRPVVLVHDPAEALDLASFPAEVEVATRDALGVVQDRLAQVTGTSAILYVQTCAAEKRRRRKRGTLTAPDTRVFILPDLCEGCGDCGVQSNCVAIQPLETPLGRKRQIDQSACNVDLSCLNGFCPAMVTVQGGSGRRPAPEPLALPDLAAPDLPPLTGIHNILVTGIGGTGVVTIGAVLTQAAHIAGLGAAMIEVTGMAQKGGAVLIHCRIAPTPADISAIRLAPGECDTLLGGDLVVAGGRGLPLLAAGRTHGVVNAAEIVTGAFTRDRDFRLPSRGLRDDLEANATIDWIDAGALAVRLMGDGLYANMIVLGAAWQRGQVPLPLAALEQAIRLNGAQVDANLRAFAIGRQAVVDPAFLPEVHQESAATSWESTLLAHTGPALVARWKALVAAMPAPELAAVVAGNFARLLAVKDEYEVARHLAATRASLPAALADAPRLSWHLAPPFLPGRDGHGRPRKRRFGPWAAPVWAWLARLRALRGTWADPFGHTAERRAERALIVQYDSDLRRAAPLWSSATRDAILAMAGLPAEIRGFGPVKAAAMDRAAQQRLDLWARIDGSGPSAAQ